MSIKIIYNTQLINKFPDVAERYKDIDEKAKYEVDFNNVFSFNKKCCP